MSVHEYARRERSSARTWRVTLGLGRELARTYVSAPSAERAARLAQRRLPGWTAILVEDRT